MNHTMSTDSAPRPGRSRRRRRGRSAVIGSLLAAAALVVAACSGGSSGGSGNRDTSLIEDAGPPQPGGTLIQNTANEAPTLDPHKSASSYTHQGVSGLVYSKLLEFKSGPDVKGTLTPAPDLAEKWSHSDDATVWTFNLRKGVKFQNVAPVNGREFTAADVVCTFDRIKTLPGIQKSLIDIVNKVETPDPYTVVISLKTPYAAFDETAANYYMSILPCEGTRGEFDLATNPIGTGPFMLKSWERNVQRTYVKNPTYFIEGKPYIDQYQMQFIVDPAASVAAYRSGELDIASPSAQLLDSVINTVPDSQRSLTYCLCNYAIVMNQNVKPFSDLRVRQAVQAAYDREGLAKSTGTDDSLMTGPVPSLLFGGLTPEEAVEGAPYDPDKAKKLLAEAGYPNGFDVTLTLTDSYGPSFVNYAQWVQEDLKRVGINATLQIVDYATWFSLWQAGNYTMGYAITSAFLSADEWLTSYWRSGASRNWFGISDPKLDAMIDEQRGILDRDEREEKLLDTSRYIQANIANPVTSFNPAGVALLRPWVHNWYPLPEWGPSWIKNVWLGPDSPRR